MGRADFADRSLMTEFSGLVGALLPAVLKAGRIVMRHFRTGTGVATKAGGSPVTAADSESEAVLLEALAAAAPGVEVVAEEMMEGRMAPGPGAEFCLVVPRVGTRDFIAGRDEFTINIGLVRDRAPCFGIIYAPAISRLFMTLGPDTSATVAVAPDSSASRLSDLAARRIFTRPISEGAPLKISVSRSHQGTALAEWLSGVNVGELANVASSLKFCRVAEGESDVYPRFKPTKEWDTAAGHAILAAAGGLVTRCDGTPLLYGKHEVDFLNPSFIAAASRLESLFIVNAGTTAVPGRRT
jgi:3'(2'),5'-bisphosphate nucleotidase